MSWIAVCGIAFVVLANGCNKKKEQAEAEPPQAPDVSDIVAIIDLNAVAQEIGAHAKIEVALKKKETELIASYNGLKAELQKRVEELTLDQDLNEQQGEVRQLELENQNKLTLQAQAAQSQLLAHHSQLRQKLLADIRPVAYKIAREKGMQIVLTVSQVYAAGPHVNITSDVIKRIKEINASTAATTSQSPESPRVSVLPDGGEFVPR